MEIEVKIRALMMDPNSGTPIIILKDVQSDTMLPIWVGAYEANAIALEIEKQDASSFAGKSGGKINGGSGLPYPPFLVGDGDYHSLHSGKLLLRWSIAVVKLRKTTSVDRRLHR